MGCPVGIGPEIILKFFQQHNSTTSSDCVVIGDLGVLQKTAELLDIDISLTRWQPGSPLPSESLPVFSISELSSQKLNWGKPTMETGKAMAEYVKSATQLCQQGILDGITTCPISKSALHLGGHDFPGHTEMLAELTGERDFTMMMAGDKLRVVLVTIHCAVREVTSLLNKTLIYDRILLTQNCLKTDFGLNNPRIAVAGLNPHAGEKGLFGDEEVESLLPAIKKSAKKGINVTGPLPPDTVFLKAAAGEYDAVICMYHDQGLIPFKLLHFEDGVNVTIGLSIVRTSVDHGTAYDIAGKGIASTESLKAAVALAKRITTNRKTVKTTKE